MTQVGFIYGEMIRTKPYRDNVTLPVALMYMEDKHDNDNKKTGTTEQGRIERAEVV